MARKLPAGSKVLTKEQMNKLKGVLCALPFDQLSDLKSYINGLLQVTSKGDK